MELGYRIDLTGEIAETKVDIFPATGLHPLSETEN
jgi:hypothetical protein